MNQKTELNLSPMGDQVSLFNQSNFLASQQKPVAISDRIFIRLEEEQQSQNLIILSNEKKPRFVGIVESIGPLVKSVQVGDKVLFHAFDELPSYDENVVVIREKSLLGIYE